MAAHLYWRVRNQYANGNPIACAELELRETIGGANACVGGTPLASSEYSGSYAKGYAFDGTGAHDGQEWAAAGSGSDQWLGYQFASPVDIVEVSWTARQIFGSQTPNGALLEYSDDGITWTTKFGIKFGAFANGQTKVASAPAPVAPGANPHRYWAIFFDSYTGGICSGREAEMRTTLGGADATDTLAIGYTDGGHFSDWSVLRLFDNDLGSIFAGYGGVSVVFLQPITVDEISWTVRNGGGDNYQVPQTGRVSYSDDGATWTDAWSWAFESWVDGGTQVVSNPDAGSAPARRRRLVVVT